METVESNLVSLTVKIIIVLVVKISPCWSSASPLTLREPEVVPEAPGLLESLAEHLVFLDVVVGHRAPGELHRLLEVFLGDLGDWVLVIIYVHSSSLLQPLLLPPDLSVDALPDGELAGPLADLGQISPGETLGHLSQEGQVNLLG